MHNEQIAAAAAARANFPLWPVIYDDHDDVLAIVNPEDSDSSNPVLQAMHELIDNVGAVSRSTVADYCNDYFMTVKYEYVKFVRRATFSEWVVADAADIAAFIPAGGK